MRPIATDVACSVFLGGVNPTKTDEMIEMSFVDSGGPKLGYHVLGGARIPPGEGSVFWGWHLPVS